jgi:ribosome maturation factor RimP
MNIAERVIPLAEPICSDLAIELVDVEHAGGVLRVTVDREGGVDIDAISLITRELSRALDHDDPIPGRYTLEVSSPGLERPLRRPAHFARAAGERIKVKTKPHVEGERRVEGQLATVGDDGIEVITDDGAVRAFRFDDIERANTVFVWGPGPKPGKGPRPNRKRTATDKATEKEVHA